MRAGSRQDGRERAVHYDLQGARHGPLCRPRWPSAPCTTACSSRRWPSSSSAPTSKPKPCPSPSSDGRLSIEPSGDPAALSIRWFGNRYTLRVPPGAALHRATRCALPGRLAPCCRPATAPSSVRSSWWSAADLFRGAIEDRYVGAFFDREPYQLQPGVGGAARPGGAGHRDDARGGALDLREPADLHRRAAARHRRGSDRRSIPPAERDELHYTGALASIKSFYRLADGLRTVFLVNRTGRLLDIVDIGRWADHAGSATPVDVPCAQTYNGHARATVAGQHVCVVLNPRREIKVFAEGAQVFSFSHADWRLLDQTSKYALWQAAVGQRGAGRAAVPHGARPVGRAAGRALRRAAAPDGVAGAARGVAGPARHGAARARSANPWAPSRRDLLHLLAGAP